MNTFLPVQSFPVSARILDYRRLGKQRVEANIVYNILLSGKAKGAWVNHPCTKMWRGYEMALAEYYNCCVAEWKSRGYKNTMPFLFVDYNILVYPKWLGNDAFHAAMRSNLLRKDYEYYSQFGWKEPNNLPYIWGNIK